MQPRTRRNPSPLVEWSIAVVLVFVCQGNLFAEKPASKVLIRENFSSQNQDELTEKLRAITGWSELGFDQNGGLRLGETEPTTGSKAARELLLKANFGTNIIILEDAGRRPDVVFCRVVPGRWIHGWKRPPAYVLLIDVDDFHQVLGDEPARAAFDVAWGVLHELEHVVNDSTDAELLGETGECEDHLNAMRRELDLPERAEYFFTLFPANGDQQFKSRLVRLAFERRMEPTNKTKRYWLVWDATVVGGLTDQKQLASAR